MTSVNRFCWLVNFLNYQKARGRTVLNSIPQVSCLGGNNILYYSTKNNPNPSEKMTETLRLKFPLAKEIKVVDVSGGCGSMYEIFVESVEFKGLTMVKQHRLINDILKEDIKQMHGLRIQTKIPENG